MLLIRFLRVGKKNQPSFKIVVIDRKRASRRGRSVEEVGFYNPLKKDKNLKTERIKYWISVGAQPSDTVRNLLIAEKIIEGIKKDVHKKSKKGPAEAKSAEAKVAEVKPTEEKPAEAEKTEEKPAKNQQVEEKLAEEKLAEKPVEETKTKNPSQETAK